MQNPFLAVICALFALWFWWLVATGWRTGQTTRNGFIGRYAVTYVRRKQPVKFAALLVFWTVLAVGFSYGVAVAVFGTPAPA